jgi:hypothetical protein
MYTAYEETIRVPLVFSYPAWFPKPVETDSFATLIDLLPTLASIAGVQGIRSLEFRGTDLHPILKNPKATCKILFSSHMMIHFLWVCPTPILLRICLDLDTSGAFAKRIGNMQSTLMMQVPNFSMSCIIFSTILGNFTI